MFAMQEAYVAELALDRRRVAAQRRLARQVASAQLWNRVDALVSERRRHAGQKLDGVGSDSPDIREIAQLVTS